MRTRPFWSAGAESWTSAAALAVAAGSLGNAIQYANGALHPSAITGLTLCLAAALVAAFAPRPSLLEWAGPTPAMLLLAGAAVLAFGDHLVTPAGIYLRVTPETYVGHHRAIALAAVLFGLGLSPSKWVRRLAVPLMLLVFFWLGLWMIRASPSPIIDVFVWHREAFDHLKAGANPYAVHMPNIYGHVLWYAPGMADAATVRVGYPYPPLSLLLAAPGHFLAGDYRYGNLVSITLAGALMAYARPGRLGTLAAGLFLFTPRGLFVLEQGWTEPHGVLMLALTVFAACRAPRLLPWAIGLLLAVKQYFVLTLPLLYFLRPDVTLREWAAMLGKAVLLAAALNLPFFLWGPKAFIDSVVLFQARQPFRVEALSFLAHFAKDGQPAGPLWLSFATVPLVWALALWRAPRTPAGFALATGLLFTAFFAFAKQAFCNYYYMVVGTLCLAVAAFAPSRLASGPRR